MELPWRLRRPSARQNQSHAISRRAAFGGSLAIVTRGQSCRPLRSRQVFRPRMRRDEEKAPYGHADAFSYPARTSITHAVKWLAARVLDLARPGVLHAGDHGGRHRNVVEFLGGLGALVVGPGEELQRLGGGSRILRLGVD